MGAGSPVGEADGPLDELPWERSERVLLGFRARIVPGWRSHLHVRHRGCQAGEPGVESERSPVVSGVVRYGTDHGEARCSTHDRAVGKRRLQLFHRLGTEQLTSTKISL